MLRMKMSQSCRQVVFGCAVTVLNVVLAGSSTPAQETKVPGGSAPLLRIIPDGPLSAVRSLAFSPDGQTLYAGGWDKVVHVWLLRDGQFTYSPESTFRVPVGGGLDGGITAIDVSKDGQWLAIGGRGAKRNVAGTRERGFVFPGASLGEERWLDEGLIYVYHTGTRAVIELRGHQGTILDLAFAPANKAGEQVLVSAADVWKNGDYRGEITAWNVAQQQPIATIDTMPVQTANGIQQQRFPDMNAAFPCQVAAIRTGEAVNDVRVGVSWGDLAFAFRVWDVSRNRFTRPANGNALMCVGCAAASPGEFLFLAGDSVVQGNARRPRVQVRRIDGTGANDLLDLDRSSTILHQEFSRRLPTSAAVLPNGDVVAAIANTEAGKAELSLVRNNSQAPVTVEAWTPLSIGPFLATDGTGTYVAVAGNANDEIRVYRIDDVRAGKNSPQVLRSQTDQFQSIEFVESGADLGLKLTWLGESPAASETQVLNLFSGKILSEPAEQAGWTLAEPETPWTITHEMKAANEATFTAKRPTGPAMQIQVSCDAGEILKVGPYVTIPAGEFCPVPVLVTGVHCNDQPQLRIYNLETGNWVRRYVAHSGLIRDLAVSRDGRFLASAASDRTVCVWSLSTLGDTLGQFGLLRSGNTLMQADAEDGVVIVREGIPELPADTKIFGIIERETRPISEGWQLYERVQGMKPGTKIVLDTNAGQKTVTVGQAIDELRPLLSLFFTENATGGKEWIGWSPLGPYDRSDPAVETRLGWHFNTGDPTAPARLAAVDDYRDTFYTPRLLHELLTTESIPEKKPIAPPQISIVVPTADGGVVFPDDRGQFLTRSPKIAASFSMSGEFPPDRIAAASATLENSGGTFVLSVNRTERDTWQVEAPQGSWLRESQRLSVKLVSDERPSRVFAEQAIIRYQPDPPQLAYDAKGFVPTQEDMEVAFEVVPNPLIPAIVQLHYVDGTGVLLAEQTWPAISTRTRLTHTLKLTPGLGTIMLSAMNEGAAYSFERDEQASAKIPLDWRPSPPSDVHVTLNSVIVEGQEHPILNGAVGEPFIHNSLQLQVTTQSEDPLAWIKVVQGEQSTDAPGFEAGMKQFKFLAPVVLSAGRQVVAVVARSTKGIESTAQVSLEYLPPLPVIAADSITPTLLPDAPANPPPSPDGRLALVAPWHDGNLLFTARLEALQSEAGEVTPQVMVDGEPISVEISRNNDELAAQVLIPPGLHRLQWRLLDGRGRQGFGQDHEVQFQRPPQLLDVQLADDIKAGRLATLTARYRSPENLPLLRDSLLVRVNGVLTTAAEGTQVVHAQGEEWTVTVPDIPLLKDGPNTLELDVDNAEGKALVTASVQAMARLTIPAPEIQLTPLPPNVQVSSLNVEFFVESEGILSVPVVSLDGRAGDVPANPVETTDIATAERKTLKRHRFQATIDLASGQNKVLVTARNEGGQEVVAGNVTFTPVPVTVLINQLGDIKPERRLDGSYVFPNPLPESLGLLDGIVKTSQEQQGKINFAQIWVNSFNQRTVPLLPVAGKKGEYSFSAEVTLNLKLENLVEIVLPELAVSQETRLARTFYVDCANPDASQELFLLIISPGMHQEANREALKKELIDKAREGLEARLQNGEWVSSSFSRIHNPAILLGREAGMDNVNGGLAYMKRVINSIPARPDSSSRTRAVLMMYYEGREYRLEKDGREEFILATTNNWDSLGQSPIDNLTSSFLSSTMESIQGAHMLFLDVEAAEGSAKFNWPSDPRLGVWRLTRTQINPEEVTLMSAIGRVVPRSSNVGELTTGLQEFFGDYKAGRFDPRVSLGMNSIPFGGQMTE